MSGNKMKFQCYFKYNLQIITMRNPNIEWQIGEVKVAPWVGHIQNFLVASNRLWIQWLPLFPVR